jgi:hypothetical protein
VNGQVTGGPATSGPGGSTVCTGTTNAVWNITANSNVNGGTTTNDATLPACQASCLANASCSGLDFDNVNSPRCWLTLYPSPVIRVGLSPGVDHYTLVARPTSPNCQTCVIQYTSTADTNVYGGVPTNDATLAGCQTTCSNNASCIGLDWDQVAVQKCWLTFSGLPRVGGAPGVTHYTISRSPAGCVPGAGIGIGCVWLSDSGLVATVSGPDNLVSYSNDINEATVFLTVNCLGQAIPEAEFNETCVSFTMQDNPGLYVREQYGRFYVQQKYDDNFVNRFAEDASFFTMPSSAGFSTVQPSAADDYYLSVDSCGNLGVAKVGTNLFCSNPPSTSPVQASCPYTWSRINAVRSYVMPTTIPDGTSCRQACLTKPNCVGVSYNRNESSTSCYFRISTAPNPLFVSAPGYSHYELWTPYPNSCQRGCVSTWVPSSTPYSVLDSFSTDTEFECRRRCARNMACFGISYNSNTCTRLTTQSGNTPAKWTINRIFTDCGPCVSSVVDIIGYYDPAAVLQAQVADSGRCLTICLNNPKCVGYEIRAGICYTSLWKNLTLTSNSSMRHTDVIRSPCGNGCQQEWDIYFDSQMSSGATISYDPAATTGRDCRQNCVRRGSTQCNMIDWNPTSANCTYGVNNPVDFGTAAAIGSHHYDLYSGVDCN